VRKMLSISLALLGTTLHSTGFILQKKGSGWIGWKGKRDKNYIIMLCINKC